MAKIEIKERFCGAVLFAHEAEGNALRVTLEAAVSARAYLGDADLRGADLSGAGLSGAYLRGADLRDAKLRNDLILRGERPIFVLGPIGSRCAHLTAYLTDEGIYLSTGCFFGTRIEFEAALDCEHGDNAHAKEYRVALAMIGAHEELWAVKDEVKEAA